MKMDQVIQHLRGPKIRLLRQKLPHHHHHHHHHYHHHLYFLYFNNTKIYSQHQQLEGEETQEATRLMGEPPHLQ